MFSYTVQSGTVNGAQQGQKVVVCMADNSILKSLSRAKALQKRAIITLGLAISLSIKGQVAQHKKSDNNGLKHRAYAGHVTTLRLRLLWNRHFPVKDELRDAPQGAVERVGDALLAGLIGNLRPPGLNE